MKRLFTLSTIVVVVLAAPPLWGGQAGAGQRSAEGALATGFVDGLQAFHESNRRNVLAAATETGESFYSFRPTPEVRSFGELVAHIADTLYFACAMMRGEPNPNEKNHRPNVVGEDSIEANRTSRDDLVAAATAAFAYCDEAFVRLAESAPDAARAKEVSFGAALAVYHTGVHYGNLVTTMRAGGLVPPSAPRARAEAASPPREAEAPAALTMDDLVPSFFFR